ncbi:ATP-binding cassette domain-containing protein [Spirosoma sp. KUDC1026]|uniref:ABC transporter ATP-binding protein n=1 Tax=Spirosoma sp. KUDC1026 TaxID=2745947 RepID=UPI00159B9B41|nr:ABC transporter ATP-binding protein [Spirosoma sp. KUDC1026]QKZ12889.1 ABC transporter ATP-binding protein [Spirosoma sp. KUDC1026]
MIELTNVAFSYQRKKPIYKGLNLTLEPGSIYGLLGPNGAGKSTLLRLLAGLLYPREGTIQVGPHVPGERRPTFLENLFLVPEEFYLPPVRIRQFVRTNAPFYPRFDHQQMQRYLQEFGLTDDQKLPELSYGQKKKVLIGFGLATNTALLLMDEPTNGLDIPSKSQFRRLVAGAVDEHRTVVISTHQVRDLEALIDPVIILAEKPDGGMNVALNASIDEITRQLWFSLVAELPRQQAILYTERAVGGYAIVAERTDTSRLANESSRLDLERLFNAVQAHPDRIQILFSTSSNYTAL